MTNSWPIKIFFKKTVNRTDIFAFLKMRIFFQICRFAMTTYDTLSKNNDHNEVSLEAKQVTRIFSHLANT